MTKSRPASATVAFDALPRALDPASGSSLWLADARTAASGAVDDGVRLADTNPDKESDGTEPTALSVKLAKALSYRTFAAADADGDRFLTAEEFKNTLAASTRK